MSAMLLDLLDAVELLTKPQIEHHAQKDVAGKWMRTHTTRLEPLLTRLQAAADPDGGGTDSAASSGLSRVPVNLTAIMEHARIASQIRDWCRIRDVEPTRTPNVDTVKDLQRWHSNVVGDAGFDPAWSVRKLRSWAATIRELLEPSKSFEAHYPCPICGVERFGDRINGGGLAVEIRYDLDDEGRMINERAICRAGCETVWSGHAAVLELAEEQHEAVLSVVKINGEPAIEFVQKRILDAAVDEPKRPEVVCLCGSTRFRAEFTRVNAELSAAGSIVLAPGVFAHDGDPMTEAEKVALDELHKRKIDLADRVLVLNVGGYIGSSTRNEIDYALAHGKPVDHLTAADSESSDSGEQR